MAALPPPQAVVFDFGGVLFNWQPPVLIQSVLPHLARNDEEALALAQRVFQSFVPGSEWSEFDRGVLQAQEVCERIAARTGLSAGDVRSLMEAIPPHLVPMHDTVNWLEDLSAAGTRLHFLSNMPRPYAEFLQRSHAFLGHFQSGVFSCDVQQVKPNADIFRTAAQRIGLAPDQMVFIDDHPRNIETARALGWRAVQFVSAAQCRAELAERGWLI
jgi:putative hydrolase of the HAD superfamily